MKLAIEVSDEDALYLGALARESDAHGSVARVVELLVSTTVDGLRRPGSWERGWVVQAFGDYFTAELEQHPTVPHYRIPRSK